MGARCPTSQYFDGLLQSCQLCILRCQNLPSVCLKFNPCSQRQNLQEQTYSMFHQMPYYSVYSHEKCMHYHCDLQKNAAKLDIHPNGEYGTTDFPVTHREVPPMSAGITITYKIKGSVSPVVVNETNYIIWLVLVLFVVLLSSTLLAVIMLHRKRKLHAGSFGKNCDEITNKSRFKGADLEQGSCEIKKPVNEDNPVGDNTYDHALSDYLFPLPAVEEGAAILVTTKTSACFNPGPGVRGDAFVEI
ncbi:tumor necrosis factor receptor superfamily member 17 [Rhinoderma darwinii]|uniref:tumor necrosis factor receptor superfamily member 17 n=1 Tax=Rhinoderma darwinii TaxID=43563 RepID=UPI003F66F710